MYLSIYPSIDLSIYLSIHLSIYLPAYLSIPLSLSSLYLSMHACVCSCLDAVDHRAVVGSRSAGSNVESLSAFGIIRSIGICHVKI